MPCGFHSGFAFANDAIRVNQSCGFQKLAADVTLIAAGFLAATIRTFTFYEAVGQEPLVMFAVEHLSVLSKDIAVPLDFQQGFLDELFVDWAFRGGVVVKRGFPSSEEL